MDKFILNVGPSDLDLRDTVVKIDGDASRILNALVVETGANKRYIVSEMIKFCYPRTKINKVEFKIKDAEGTV